MKNTFKVLLCCVLFTSQSVLAELVITDLQPASEGETFPKVTHLERPSVSERINIFLQLTHLENLPNTYKQNPFEKIRVNENITSFDSWEHYHTPNNILSINLLGETIGAYPEYFDIYINFDTRTGNRVLLTHLIQENSKNSLITLLVNSIKKKIKSFITQTEKSKKHKKNKDDINYLTEQLSLYQECLNNLNDMTLDWFNFYVKYNNVVFVRERCSNHAMRALDELDDHHIAIPIKSLIPYLTTYGKNVLSSSNKQLNHTDLAGKLLTGKVGSAKAHIIFNKIYEDNSVDAMYWYDKYQQPIKLQGIFKNNTFNAEESHYHKTHQKWIKKGIIDATWQGGKLIGTWQNITTKKMYSFKFE